ncbi:Crp/Fnr family transcriptional regulator [Aquimarina sp. RZ0]|uniref:Crp/Fnr family transcriptional regulator n=1 Tax=Aquimarina sp. RZ0 TaxID=2607730 RepID=UPI00165F365A|nr:Crp/Fnr family transcriptional regulator [Aquimarina sp. RZ0]
MKNEVFIQQGRICNKLAYLENGAFRMFYTTDSGDEVNTEFIVSKGFITDYISFLKKEACSVTISAIEDSEISIIDTNWLDKSLLRKLAMLGKNYIQKKCLPVLLDYQIIVAEKPALRYQMFENKYPEYIQRIPQKHIASYLKIRPETLSRIKRKFIDLNQLKS